MSIIVLFNYLFKFQIKKIENRKWKQRKKREYWKKNGDWLKEIVVEESLKGKEMWGDFANKKNEGQKFWKRKKKKNEEEEENDGYRRENRGSLPPSISKFPIC